ncbi:50S ribosomal subunit assembly factor [Frankliniella fusca]|uniref:50S ribosomal subunit assembly factor n=1 Tax=Frankliniella fusca TaxID=407009 RepID=A0AAE1HBF0_9NEOP|nr:50S ribosomal subunit assembly factor [Frankliniella fusca]
MQWRVGVVYFLQGQRDGVIYHQNDGYFYHKHHDLDRPDNPFITLRCIKRKSLTSPCWGLAVMSRDGSHFECTRHHTHPPDVWNIEERFLRQSLINAVSSGDPQPFSVIIRNVGMRGGFSFEARSRLTLARMRTALTDERMRLLPPIPNTLFELATYLNDPLFANVTPTIDNTDNIFAGACGDFGAGTFSVVFMSRRQATHLANAIVIFADGTFKKKPKKPRCGQMFVISYVWYNEQTTCKHIVTCARILMQCRTTEAYIELLQYLRAILPGWNPQTIMADHELAQVHAWMHVFPNANITTCLFHFEVVLP